MKLFIMLAVLTANSVSYAEPAKKEFDEVTEIKCYQEAKAVGCVSNSEEEDPACMEKSKKKLSADCLKLHESKKR